MSTLKQASPGEGPGMLKKAQVAYLLGVGVDQLPGLVQRKVIPPPEVWGPRTKRWRRADIERVLAAR